MLRGLVCEAEPPTCLGCGGRAGRASSERGLSAGGGQVSLGTGLYCLEHMESIARSKSAARTLRRVFRLVEAEPDPSSGARSTHPSS
jgi:hypothetical protein